MTSAAMQLQPQSHSTQNLTIFFLIQRFFYYSNNNIVSSLVQTKYHWNTDQHFTWSEILFWMRRPIVTSIWSICWASSLLCRIAFTTRSFRVCKHKHSIWSILLKRQTLRVYLVSPIVLFLLIYVCWSHNIYYLKSSWQMILFIALLRISD